MFFRCGKTAQNACFSLWFATFGASNIAKSALAFHSWKRKARAVGKTTICLKPRKWLPCYYEIILHDSLLVDEFTSRRGGKLFIVKQNQLQSSFLLLIILFNLLTHPCGYIRRVCILQQLFCFCIKHHRVSECLLPAMKRYVVFRQNTVHVRY